MFSGHSGKYIYTLSITLTAQHCFHGVCNIVIEVVWVSTTISSIASHCLSRQHATCTAWFTLDWHVSGGLDWSKLSRFMPLDWWLTTFCTQWGLTAWWAWAIYDTLSGEGIRLWTRYNLSLCSTYGHVMCKALYSICIIDCICQLQLNMYMHGLSTAHTSCDHKWLLAYRSRSNYTVLQTHTKLSNLR